MRAFVDGERVSWNSLATYDGCELFAEQVGGMEDEGGDAAPKTEGAPITLKVRDQAGEIMFFKVKKTTEMRKIFDAYGQRLGISAKNLKFLLDGERIKETDTPKMLELSDDDQIDVVLEQVGGSEGESKPVGDDAVITVRVRDSDENEVAFKVKKSTKMSKIIEAYATRKGVQSQAVRFTTDAGVRVSVDDTPKMLELDDDSVISAMIEQTGGLKFMKL